MNSLRHRQEFERLLTNYKPGKEAVTILRQTPLVLMAGLTASGRNTVIEYLSHTGKYCFVISDTTRKPRVEHGLLEEDGGPYWFISEEQFIDGLKKRQYIEAAIIHDQQVSGLNIGEIKAANKNKLIAVTEVTPDGIETYLEIKPDTITLFFLPPSYDIWLDRLRQRGAMPDSELERRKRSALKEIEDVITNENYKIIVNEDIEKTVTKVRSVIEEGGYSLEDQQYGILVANRIKESLVV